MNEIEIANIAHQNYEQIVILRKSINLNFWQLVERLKIARDNRQWVVLDCESWASYLAQPEIDLNEGTVNNYISIYDKLSKYIKTSDMCEKLLPFDIDIGKLALIAPKVTDENAEELLTKAKTLSRSDLRKELVIKNIPKPVPEGKYNVIYIDPPWQYDNSGISGAAENHYPTMSIEEMQKIEIPSDENAVMFMWVTNPFIKEAIQLCEYWGFEYKTNIVWVKDIAGQGFYVKGQHELLFICVKGNFRPSDDLYIRSVVQEPRQEHSQKPIKFYEIIETLYPDGKYLEMFARNKRNKWTSWGNEV
jgi:N6-adenosine-specific RNA methylase IME4